jgi:hypothetical protein
VVRSLSDPQRDLLLWELKQGCMTAVVNCLPPGERAAFVVCHVLKLPDEAAAEPAITESAYKVRLSRARKKVGDYLAPRCEHVNPMNPCRCPARVGTALHKGFIGKVSGEVSLRKRADIPYGRYGTGLGNDDVPMRDISAIYGNLPDPDLPDLRDRIIAAIDSGQWTGSAEEARQVALAGAQDPRRKSQDARLTHGSSSPARDPRRRSQERRASAWIAFAGAGPATRERSRRVRAKRMDQLASAGPRRRSQGAGRAHGSSSLASGADAYFAARRRCSDRRAIVEVIVPADRRMNPSEMPSAARVSGGTEAWVMIAGCSMRLSTPPSDSAQANTFTAFRNFRAAGRPPWISKVSMPPKPFICFRASACCGWLARPG